MKLIAPSVLSADFGHLADDLEMINRSEADWLHIDVMYGSVDERFCRIRRAEIHP